MTTKYEVSRQRVVIKGLPHIGQEMDWDCGIACLRMVMRYINPNLSDVELNAACRDHDLHQSVWTIDLAYLCGRLGIKHAMFTKTLGAQPDYAKDSFYVSNVQTTYDEEQERVNNLFSNAVANGINVQKKFMERAEILQHLEKEQPVIVLLNDKLLVRNQGSLDEETDEIGCCGCLFLNWCKKYKNRKSDYPENREYWGHYVVISGYDLLGKYFILNDPSLPGEQVSCSFDNLDLARKSFGTDEDILFIYPNT